MDTNENVEDIELLQAMETLRLAKEKKARATKMAEDAAAAALAEHRAKQEREAAAALKEYEEIQARHKAKKAQEADRLRLEQLAKDTEQKRLEQEVEILAEQKRVEEARIANVRRITEQAYQEECAAAALEEQVRAASQPRVEEKPVTLNSPSHPLSAIFGTNAAPVVQNEGLDSHQQALLQAQADKVAESLAKAWLPRKSAGNRYVDSSSSFSVETAIYRATSIRANTQALDRLSSVYEAESIMRAWTEIVLPSYERNVCGHDQLLFRLEQALESNCNATS
jgi:hypothetical protein